MPRLRVLTVTTSRADWNALGMVHKALQPDADTRVAAIEYHPAMGTIWEDGFLPVVFEGGHNAQSKVSVYSLLKAAGEVMPALGEVVDQFRPDIAMILGDRHEMLAVAMTLAMKGVPIAHIGGGDVTGGSLDEGWRHAISKISNLHFPTNAPAATRLIRMGEDPADVFMLGSPSADRIATTPVMIRADTLAAVGLPENTRSFVLANWQADTTEAEAEWWEALKALRPSVVLVGSNPDVAVDGSLPVRRKPTTHMVYHQSLPTAVYLSCLKHAVALIGNSSSGFYEAPYYGTPVVNIGQRQAGRTPKPNCMISVDANRALIGRGVDKALVAGRYPIEHVYGTDAAGKIATTILAMKGRTNWRKHFHD